MAICIDDDPRRRTCPRVGSAQAPQSFGGEGPSSTTGSGIRPSRAPGWILDPILRNGTTIALATWSVLAVEYALSAGLIAARTHWRKLLLLGVGLHASIALLHSLTTFAPTMMGALVLYLRPLDAAFAEPRSVARLRQTLAGVMRRRLVALRAPAS